MSNRELLEEFKKLESEEFVGLKNKVRNHLNPYWWFFGFGSTWGNKCNKCTRHLKTVERMKEDIEDCKLEVCKEMVQCWKIELWKHNLVDLEKVLVYLLKWCLEDDEIHGKYSVWQAVWEEEKGDRLGCCNSHSIPDEGKPVEFLEGKIKKDNVILIYAQNIKERETYRTKMQKDLLELGLLKNKTPLPYRRGCIQPHETVFGPWEKWYDMEKDYETGTGKK